jgi:serine phosphatase RsbU (regulator of sigma subunit)
MVKSVLKVIAVLCLLCLPAIQFAQEEKTNAQIVAEELANLKKAKTDKDKLASYTELAWAIRDSNASAGEAYADSTILFARKLKLDNYLWLGLNSKALALTSREKNEEAFQLHTEALALAEKNKFTKKIAHSLNNIANMFKRQRDYKTALQYFEKSLDTYRSIHDSEGIITACSGLAAAYGNLEDYTKALEYYQKVITMAEQQHRIYSLGLALNNIGNCYYEMHLPKKAKEYYYKAIAVNEKGDIRNSMVDSYSNYAYMLNEEGDYAGAETYYRKSLAIARTTGYTDNLIEVYGYLAEMYLAKKDFKNAYYYADTVKYYKDSIAKAVNINALHEMTQKFDSEKKQIEIENLGKENELKEKENRQQQLILFVVGFALIISLVLGTLVFKQYKKNQKANKIITEQKESLQEKQKEIVDSITYAKRIQTALLASDELLANNLPEFFVLFKPKDIVSGDFYWAASTPLSHAENDHKFYLVTADSTGHGVPGAFMSLLNISYLNESINEKKITAPNEVLNHTRNRLINALKTDGSAEGGKDGMDCTLLALDLKHNRLEYAAAYNSFYIVRDGGLIRCNSDKMPVGKSPKDHEPFNLHVLELQKGDVIYTLTDGLPDQFGGPKGKKYKYKPLEEFLLANSHLPMEQQKQLLDRNFEEWKGNLEQVDDVLVIGIRV